MKNQDLIGQRFDRLIVLDTLSKNGRGYCRCKCDCGNVVTVRNDGLKSGKTHSCGCYNRDRAKRGDNRRKHGLHETRLYRIWGAMKNRCNNPKQKEYQHYGGRGITVCDEWLHDFQAFYDWAMANGYKDGLTIDRIDNNKGYSPDNCRWATYEEQSNNKNNTIYISYNNEKHTIKEWENITGIPSKVIYWRIKHKWNTAKALTTPKKTVK